MTEPLPIDPIAEAPKTEVDPALTEKISAIKALVTTHNLLNEGLFQKAAWKALSECQNFIKGLHTQLAADALAHPDAEKIAELKSLKENQNGQS